MTKRRHYCAQVTLSQEASGGTTFYAIHVNESRQNYEIDYAFVDGYMVTCTQPRTGDECQSASAERKFAVTL